MATIVQDYGPIYGEVVNGTVQGRPNGSVYVPITNTIAISSAATTIRRLTDGTNRVNAGAYVTVVAESQDLASNIIVEVYEDAALTTQFGVAATMAAGLFNQQRLTVAYSATDPVTGNDYYIVARLMNNGTEVAVSNVLHVVGA